MTKELINKFESYKLEVVSKANGATIHKINGCLGGVCCNIDMYYRTGKYVYINLLKKSLIEIAKMTHVYKDVDDFI